MGNKLPRFLKIISLVGIFLFTFSTNSHSEITTKGTDFWVGFLQNITSSYPDSLFIFISADKNASVVLTAPLKGWGKNVSVTANTTSVIHVPNTAGYNDGSADFSNNGIHIVSDVEINVFQMEYQHFSTDGTISLPTHALGNTYKVATYSQSPNGAAEFLIVGTEDNTKIDITLKAPLTNGKPIGTYSININKGQVYQGFSSGDLTGSTISSAKYGSQPFVVYSGDKCANIPSNSPPYGYCDHICEVMYPVKTWGKRYVTIPLATRLGDTYRIVAAENGTIVRINGTNVATLNQGDFYERLIQTASYINANKDIMVLQYSNSTTFDNVTSDPFMINLSPTNQMRKDIVFHVYNFNSIQANYLNVVTYTVNKSNINLDGAGIAASFQPVPGNTSFSYAQIVVTPGAHKLLSSSDFGFNAYVYGFGQADSYGYSAGARLDTLLMTVTQNSNGLCAGIETSFSAQPAWPVSSYSWEFGDGGTSAIATPKHTFSVGGNYNVRLIVKSFDNTEADTSTRTVSITESKADFSFTGGGCNNFKVDFTDKSTAINGAISKWNWDFGDGQTDNTKNPSHTYALPGKYNIKFIASTAEDCSSIDTASVEIFPLPVADFTLTGGGCGIFDISLSDKSTAANGKILDWIWDFGDGLTSTIPSPNHTYSKPGKFLVKLTVSTAPGCSSSDTATVYVFPLPNPVIKASSSLIFCTCDSVILDAGIGYSKYEWSTNANSRIIIVSQSGNYTVTVTDTNGCVNTSQPVQVTVLTPSAVVTLPKDTIKALIGSYFAFPLLIESSSNLDFCKNYNFTARISYNKTLMVSKDNLSSTKDDQRKHITISGIRKSNDSTLFIFNMLSTLGNAEATSILIDTIEFPDCPFLVVKKNGNFKLSDVCSEGGEKRLYYWDGKPPTLGLMPNPSTGTTHIEYSLYQPSKIKLYLSDMLGRVVHDIYNGDEVKGVHNIIYDTSELPPGTYIVTLSTLNGTITRMLKVQK